MGDSPQPSGKTLNSLSTRLDFPSEWHVVLIGTSEAQKPVAGATEKQRFQDLYEASSEEVHELKSTIVDDLIPSLESVDFAEFSKAVYRYNRLSGSLFQAVQGGIYNGPQVTRIVERVRSLGVDGVGQSSWGPTVFVFCEDWEMVRQVVDQMSDFQILGIAKGLNQPRFVNPM